MASRLSFSIALSDFIAEARQSAIDTKTRVRSRKVSAFNQRVLSEGLSLETQIDFWQAMENQEKSSFGPSQDNIIEARDNVASLRKQVRTRDYRNKYNKRITAVESMKDNYENLISFLNDQLKSAVDDELKNEIQGNLQTAQKDYQQELKDEVSSLITTGERDRSLNVLDEAKDRVSKRLSKSIAAGDADSEAYWRDQMSTVKSKIGSVKAEKAVNEFKLAGIRGNSPIEQLSTLRNSMAKNQPDNIPITIDGTTFSSVHDYLNGVMVDYLEDDTKKGFFGKIQDQNSKFLDTVIKTAGEVPTATIDSLMRSINQLKTKPALQPYLQKIEDLKYGENGLITKAVEANVDRITSRFVNDLDLDGALNKLNNLSKRYGVNTDSTVDQLVNVLGKEKVQIAEQVINAAASLQADDPNLSWEDAVNQAVKGLRGGIVAPSRALELGIQGVATEAEKQAQKLTTQKTTLPGSSAGGLSNPNIAKANPGVPANSAFVSAVFVEKFGRQPVAGELRKFVGMKVADVANIVLREKSPFKNPLNTPSGTNRTGSGGTQPATPQVGTPPISQQTQAASAAGNRPQGGQPSTAPRPASTTGTAMNPNPSQTGGTANR